MLISKNYWLSLITPVLRNNQKAVSMFVAAGANLDTVDDGGNSALIHASIKPQFEVSLKKLPDMVLKKLCNH
ncbi:MAG: ANK-REP-REGION domain-containing protein [Candidatus Midichloria mitochondrii]|nr:hypothetical protein [Candidatus Midichloria mitochondrii]MDJ1256587.1 hypothetical protein [Candidatus Midichloria mitochondrii]MDJ1299182.1 hypothetical protein [Candidatus Midichloria mitochondrii]MDJ1313295.1 hypothetical protein [Candidatus Midichloria mitochondrii]MDJ1583886.1 hypothetical protein [Candidatus Midichloria mitochondrii]